MSDPVFQSTAYVPDRLIAGDFPLVTRDVTIASGILLRGAVLGRITVGGEYVLSAAAAGDGSEVPRAILVKDVDASGGPATGTVYLCGEFNENALSFGAGHDADSVRNPLDGFNVFIVSPVPA